MEYQVKALETPRKDSASAANNEERRKRSDAIWGYVFILPQLVGLVVFSLIPLITVFYLSTVSWDGLGSITFIGFQNFIDQFTGSDLRIALVNTLEYTAIVVPGGIILSLLAALALNNVRFKDVYRVLFFMPVVTSSVAVSVIWLWLLNGDFGLINQLARAWFHVNGLNWLTDSRLVIPSISTVVIWQNIGFNMIILLAGLQGIPAAYSEAARIDGANRFQLFRNVTLPMLSPTLFFAVVIAIINSFQIFDQTFVLTGGGPGKDSYTMVYHVYHQAFELFKFGPASAVSVILFAIILALTLLQFWFQRRWVTYDV